MATMTTNNTATGAVPTAQDFRYALAWIYATHTIPPEAKILSVVKILKQMKMSPIELVTTLLVLQEVYRDNADGFYRSQGLENLLNLVSRDPRGRKKFENKIGLDPLLRKVHREMDALSTYFRCSTSEVTPESHLEFDFENDVTELACANSGKQQSQAPPAAVPSAATPSSVWRASTRGRTVVPITASVVRKPRKYGLPLRLVHFLPRPPKPSPSPKIEPSFPKTSTPRPTIDVASVAPSFITPQAAEFILYKTVHTTPRRNVR
ncbi:hypothetical protein MVEN_00121400 [Mycena venus]|uniref:Uncharacterized protein n=1 Tax=Mycena venus TaxID=2733690 RepID=A0A8H6Z942_9AGAR|nr:hypothetical protein MVEN_00121400 [Mycena venus]